MASAQTFLPADQHPQWTAIGRVNVTGVGSTRMCTGTLIAPDKVLTAAHCVTTQGGDLIDITRLRFVAGWFRGDYAEVGFVSEVSGVDAFRTATAQGIAHIAADSAVLTLTEPMQTVPPLPVAPPNMTAPARILGYRHDRPHALTDAGACDITQARDGHLRMACPVTFGNSGGPVLQRRGPRWSVIGVVSAKGAGLTYAAPLPAALRIQD